MSCPYCKKTISRNPAKTLGYHESCRKRRRREHRLTEDQKTCALRGGRCTAFNGLGPCLLGLVLEHTNCKLNQTVEVVDSLGGEVWEPDNNWYALWSEIEELSRREEGLDDIVFQAEEEGGEPLTGDLLELGRLRKERAKLLQEIQRLQYGGNQ